MQYDASSVEIRNIIGKRSQVVEIKMTSQASQQCWPAQLLTMPSKELFLIRAAIAAIATVTKKIEIIFKVKNSFQGSEALPN